MTPIGSVCLDNQHKLIQEKQDWKPEHKGETTSDCSASRSWQAPARDGWKVASTRRPLRTCMANSCKFASNRQCLLSTSGMYKARTKHSHWRMCPTDFHLAKGHSHRLCKSHAGCLHRFVRCSCRSWCMLNTLNTIEYCDCEDLPGYPFVPLSSKLY